MKKFCDFCILATDELNLCVLCGTKMELCERCFMLHLDFHEDILDDTKGMTHKKICGMDCMVGDNSGVF